MDDLNTLPAVQSLTADIDALDAVASQYAVTTAEQYEAGAADLRRVKGAAKRLEDTRTGITKPINDSLRRINEFFRAPAERLTRIERQIKAALSTYVVEQERQRQLEQARLEAAARKEREKLAAQAAKAEAAGREERAAVLAERAAAVVAPVAQHAAPKVAGLSYREVWKFRVKDESQLPREYLTPDLAKLDKVVQALKADTTIAGIEVYSERQVASRAG